MAVNVLDDDGFEVDLDEPPGYRAGRLRIGGDHVGASVYRLDPGEAVCPYHWEAGQEEWLVVLEGTPTVRTPAGTETLAAGDVVLFGAGPDGAHRVGNEVPGPARVLLVSERGPAAASAYPDSDKVGVFSPDLDLLFRRADARDYYDGEL